MLRPSGDRQPPATGGEGRRIQIPGPSLPPSVPQGGGYGTLRMHAFFVILRCTVTGPPPSFLRQGDSEEKLRCVPRLSHKVVNPNLLQPFCNRAGAGRYAADNGTLLECPEPRK
jgi:hypothetical protein